jgi:hypothetical protein
MSQQDIHQNSQQLHVVLKLANQGILTKFIAKCFTQTDLVDKTQE